MDSKVNEVEFIKADSNFLRGTLVQSMSDAASGALADSDAQITKFHGFYQQDDRDQRAQRQELKLEPFYSFMLRARLPGGVCTPEQWLAIDDIGRRLGNGSIRLTTRQTFQFHGILKHNLKSLIQDINRAMIDSIGGCGDVNRNVMCNPNPLQSSVHAEVYSWARRISEHLLPKTRAYHEIWLDGEKLEDEEREPLYGDTYLPRKFKTAVAIPPFNDVDIYTNDMGFVAIVENDELRGFNVLAGGGMGTTHGDKGTYPRLADTLGFIEPQSVLAVAEAIIAVQRDEGDRINRRFARLKYTVDRLGVDDFKKRVEARAGINFAEAKPISFVQQGDRFGWIPCSDGNWSLTLFIENGRVADSAEANLMTGLREIARLGPADFRITPNQNLVITGIAESQKAEVEDLAIEHGLIQPGQSAVHQNSLACVALPTCPQAMAEAERYLPDFIERLQSVLARHDLRDLDVTTRMTGCPNGCARPFVAEIGLVGKGPGRYNLLLGGDGRGQRLNRLYRENLDEAGILQQLDELFGRYAEEREHDERFGDFVIRAGVVKRVVEPRVDFHD
jgi:sulfite reductase (NADPH) hemoprotein beta-component